MRNTVRENIVFLAGNIPGTVRQLKEQAGKDKVGGGQTDKETTTTYSLNRTR
jgi:hypothetical protein